MPDYLFKKIKKSCESCGSQLILKNTRDIERKRFCSRSCQLRHAHKKGLVSPPSFLGKEHPNWKGGISKIKKFCTTCGKKIYYRSVNCLCRACFNRNKRIKSYNQHSFKFNKGKNLQTFICAECGNEFQGYKSQYLGKNTFCSYRCNSTYHGKKRRKICNFYKDGRTPLRLLIKNSGKMGQWRERIYQRDDYNCVWCGYNGNDLHPHHLISFSDLLTAFFERYREFNPEENKDELLELAWNFGPFWDIDNGITLCKECHLRHHNLLKKGEANP